MHLKNTQSGIPVVHTYVCTYICTWYACIWLLSFVSNPYYVYNIIVFVEIFSKKKLGSVSSLYISVFHSITGNLPKYKVWVMRKFNTGSSFRFAGKPLSLSALAKTKNEVLYSKNVCIYVHTKHTITILQRAIMLYRLFHLLPSNLKPWYD
jgi:hypothetical protein